MPAPDPRPDRDEVDTLRAIVEGTAGHTGQEFFRALVRNLSRATGVPNAFVAEFADSDTRVRTLAFGPTGIARPFPAAPRPAPPDTHLAVLPTKTPRPV